MRACVVHGAGDLRVEEVPEREPGPGEAVVDVLLGGICGSDLHYARDGAVGAFRVREPLVPGHEVVGRVREVRGGAGTGATSPAAGELVAVHPATVCGRCRPCRAGRRELCERVRYLGSAARFPHVQGGMCERLVVPADQLRVLPAGLAPERAVLAEPLAVALHAVGRAGPVLGRDVLVTGAGPIGVLVVAAARAAGAASVTVTDLVPEALAVAEAVGATATVLAGGRSGADGRSGVAGVDGVDGVAGVDGVDVAVEASGSPAALAAAVSAVRPGGRVVALGMQPPTGAALPGSALVTREVEVVGSFRFDAEFDAALALLAGGLDVAAVVTAVRPLAGADAAFALAADRSRSCKVLLEVVR